MNADAFGRGTAGWSDLSTGFAELTEILYARGRTLTPDLLVQATQQGIPHADGVGITLVASGGSARTVAASSALARAADQIQYELHEGPCLEAAEDHDLIEVGDLASERRWPAFTPRAVAELGVRNMACLSLPVPDGPHRAALNLYATRPCALSPQDMAAGAILASFMGLALQAEEAQRKAAHLESALETSRQIGTAMGILMAREMLTSDQAFAQLRDTSQRLNRKLREVALFVVDTGQLPDVPKPAGHPHRRGPDSAS